MVTFATFTILTLLAAAAAGADRAQKQDNVDSESRVSSLRAAAIPHSSDHHLPFHRSLVFDPSPSCNDACGQDQTICVHNGDPVPIVSNQEEIPYGLVTFCQQGCEIVAETVMAEGITIVEVFMHVACEEDDYPKVGKDGKPKAGQMNQNDKCVINSPATNTATCRVPLSAVDQNIRDCWNDGARRTTETIIKLTTTAFPDPWTPPDPAQCISSYPILEDDCPCAEESSTASPTTPPGDGCIINAEGCVEFGGAPCTETQCCSCRCTKGKPSDRVCVQV